VGAEGVAEFLGIPYAEPPVRNLRFRPSRPAKAWEGVRDATALGPACIQGAGAGPKKNVSEDCLYLNVFAPAGASALPVFVWVHGGAFISGSGGDYNGTQLARQGLVVVTFNYRLAGLGCYASQALAAEDAGFPSSGGMNAIGDQVLALKWVQQNIHAFGGNPAQVTVAGESSGSISISFLLHMPAAKGLFRRVAAGSGSCIVAAAGSGLPRSPAEAAGISAAWAASLGCGGGNATLGCLRGLPAESLVRGPWFGLRPSVDGALLAADPALLPLAALPQESGAPELLFGSTSLDTVCAPPWDDGSGTGPARTRPWPVDCPAFNARLEELLGAGLAAEVAEKYPCGKGTSAPEVARLWLRLSRDVAVACPMAWLAGKALAAAPAARLRAYEFAYNANASWRGLAPHGAELPYVFDDASAGYFPDRLWNGSLAAAVSGYWGSFAASGTPRGPAAWPAFDEASERFLRLGAESAAEVGYGQQSRCGFWRSFLAGGPSGSGPRRTKAYRALVNQCFT